jgi:hypothetical protein
VWAGDTFIWVIFLGPFLYEVFFIGARILNINPIGFYRRKVFIDNLFCFEYSFNYPHVNRSILNSVIHFKQEVREVLRI